VRLKKAVKGAQIVLGIYFAVVLIAADAAPLAQAHSHNDYHRPIPLADALAHGFCGVEADVFLVDGRLLVGHERKELQPGRTLRTLYLEPLRRRLAQHEGAVYPKSPPFWLLIDVKTDGAKTYQALQAELKEYADVVGPGKVRVVLSGNRAVREIAADANRLVGVDGRLSDLASKESPELMPWISDNWRLHFRWRGQGPMPDSERQKLRGIVAKAHAAGRRVRLWATPENEAVWTELLAAEVDLINTDELDRLQNFLSQKLKITGQE
jgi:hypothetical protein